MYDLFIGCDISKLEFDVSYFEDEPQYAGKFSNNIEGFNKCFNELSERTGTKPENWLVCFENTGVYSKAFCEWLASQQVSFKEENALIISRSLGLRRGKNDRSDSRDLCRYVFEKRDSLEPTILSNPLVNKLKQLLTRRDLLVKHRRSLLVALSEQKHVLDPEIHALFQSQTEVSVELYGTQIKQLEEQIKETMKKDHSMKTNNELAQSVVGVGLILSAYLIAFTENYTRFSNARKFASYSGTAPFLHNQSGNKKGANRVSHLANKKIKSLLGMGGRAAIQFDPEINQYYHRKIAEGKPNNLVLNNVKNKLIQRVFASIKRQTPYVKLMNYA